MRERYYSRGGIPPYVGMFYYDVNTVDRYFADNFKPCIPMNLLKNGTFALHETGDYEFEINSPKSNYRGNDSIYEGYTLKIFYPPASVSPQECGVTPDDFSDFIFETEANNRNLTFYRAENESRDMGATHILICAYTDNMTDFPHHSVVDHYARHKGSILLEEGVGGNAHCFFIEKSIINDTEINIYLFRDNSIFYSISTIVFNGINYIIEIPIIYFIGNPYIDDERYVSNLEEACSKLGYESNNGLLINKQAFFNEYGYFEENDIDMPPPYCLPYDTTGMEIVAKNDCDRWLNFDDASRLKNISLRIQQKFIPELIGCGFDSEA